MRHPAGRSPAPIGFSYDIFCAQRAGGVSRCMVELMAALDTGDIDWRLWAGQQSNEILAELAGNAGVRARVTARDGASPGRIKSNLQNEPQFARWLAEHRLPLVHRTYYALRDLLPRGTRRIETLHDMWDERSSLRSDPGAWARSWIKRRALARADAIVCVSEATLNELTTRWPWAASKAVTIRHGVRRLADTPIAPALDRPYFLFVGRRGFYKNFGVAIEGLQRSQLGDHLLVCFGGGPLDHEEARRIEASIGRDRVLQIEGTDAHLAGLYEGASALLYPSEYEGFGLPLLEAMIHGCPVITTPLTALPEVGGDAAIYAQPRDLDAWASAMRVIALDTAAAADMRAAGHANTRRFSWQTTAEHHAELYRSLT